MFKRNFNVFCLVVLVFLSLSNYAQAYKLHLLLACDENARGIGPSVKLDRQAVFNHFFTEFGSDLDIVSLPFQNLTRESVLNAIDSMVVENTDTILFYYSGHGAYDINHGTQIFQFDSGQPMSRVELLMKLRKKHAKLLVLVTDCCNKTDVEEAMPSASQLMPKEEPGAGSIKLFKTASGELDITSSRIGEVSLSDKSGSCFTRYFMDFLQDNVDNSRVEWKDMQNSIQPKLTRNFKEYLRLLKVSYLDLEAQGAVTIPGVPTKQYDQRMYIYACPDMPLRFGAGVRCINHRIVVQEVRPRTPAERVGISAGDVLLEINGSPLSELYHYDILINYSSQRMKLKVKKANGEIQNMQVFLAYD